MPFENLNKIKDANGFVSKQDFIECIENEFVGKKGRGEIIFNTIAGSHATKINIVDFTEESVIGSIIIKFLAVDTNGDGSIEKSELKQVIGEGNIDIIFASLDINGDGKITLEEAIKQLYQKIEEEKRRRKRVFYNLHNKKDEKGFVTKEDFVDCIAQEFKGHRANAGIIFHSIAGNDANKINVTHFTEESVVGKLMLKFLELDENADGTLEKSELRGGLTNHIKKGMKYLDINGDGKIGFDEFVKQMYGEIDEMKKKF